jgi:hypothetical protein
MPAGFVYKQFSPQLSSFFPPIKLYGIDGTVWSGQISVLEIGPVSMESVTWELHPTQLLFGKIVMDVSSNGQKITASGVLGVDVLDNSLYLQDLDTKISAAYISQIAGDNMVEANGIVIADIKNIEISDGLLSQATGNLQWQQAGIAAPIETHLGDLHMDISTLENGIKAVLSDKGGPLIADGIVNLKQDGSYQFNGKFASRDSSQPQIDDGLRFLGRPGVDGKVTVSFSGNYHP